MADATEFERVERRAQDGRRDLPRGVPSFTSSWLEDVKGAKPATLRDHRSVLAESGIPYRRGDARYERTRYGGAGGSAGGDSLPRGRSRRCSRALPRAGASPSTVNKYRARISTVFNYGMRETTYGLPANPVSQADKRREPHRALLVYYSPEELEALAADRALPGGRRARSRGGDMPACAWASCWRSAGATSISPAMP